MASVGGVAPRTAKSDGTVTIFCGASGSGKSHKARKMAAKLARASAKQTDATVKIALKKASTEWWVGDREPRLVVVTCSADHYFTNPTQTEFEVAISMVSEIDSRGRAVVTYNVAISGEGAFDEAELRGDYKFDPAMLQAAHSACQRAAHGAAERGAQNILIANTNTSALECRPYVAIGIALKYALACVYVERTLPDGVTDMVAFLVDANRHMEGDVATKAITGQLQRLKASKGLSPTQIMATPKPQWAAAAVVHGETDTWVKACKMGKRPVTEALASASASASASAPASAPAPARASAWDTPLTG